MLKLSDNPPILSPAVASLRDATGDWSVVQTKARSEKALAWAMQSANAVYFLPMIARVTFSGGRKRTGMQPLFNGYLFVKSCDKSWAYGVASRHIARIIPVREQGVLTAELLDLERALTADAGAILFPHIMIGGRYRVKAGPLAGLIGTVAEIEGTTHVVLNVTVLGQAAALPVDLSLLDSVDA